MKKLNIDKIFNDKIEFIKGAHNFSQIPQHHYPEIAVIGASNSGKSSLINAIFNQKIAIVSSTPGRTRQLNFFKISGYRDGFVFVDLPGYGYAKANNKHIKHWQDTVFDYLANRPNLKKVFLLIEAVKGMKINDLEVIEFFNSHAIFFQIIVTKIDKINIEKQQDLSKILLEKMQKYIVFNNNIILTSSSKKYGIYEIKKEILETLKNL